jgi:hypothetical protein
LSFPSGSGKLFPVKNRSLSAVQSKEPIMPLELLRELSQKSLPLTVEDAPSIDKLRVLRASGHVAVLLPTPSSENQFARVLAITAEGWAAIRGVNEPVHNK